MIRWTTAVLTCFLAAPFRLGAQEPIAFANVNVVPMDRETVLTNHALVVRDGRIAALGPADAIPVPPDARVIDGEGGYLMPGLADMHVHLMRDELELLLYVANGVTTVRELSGEPLYLEWREEIARGDRVGPNLIIAGPVIDGTESRRLIVFRVAVAIAVAALAFFGTLLTLRLLGKSPPGTLAAVILGLVGIALGAWLSRTQLPIPDVLITAGRAGTTGRTYVGTAWEARRAVGAIAERYDAVKLYEHLSPAAFTAAVREARRLGIPTTAHAPLAMPFADVLASGLDELAHAYLIVEEVLDRTDTVGLSVEEIDARYTARLGELVRDVRSAGMSVTTTLMPLPEVYQRYTDTAAFLAREDVRYRPADVVDWMLNGARTGESPEWLRDIEAHIRWGLAAVRALVEAGGHVAAGTDASPQTVVAGFSMAEELQHLLEARLSPFHVLRTATSGGAGLMGDTVKWGMVQVGYRADFLLLAADPLQDLDVMARPNGVMVRGRWFDRAALDAALATVVGGRTRR